MGQCALHAAERGRHHVPRTWRRLRVPSRRMRRRSLGSSSHLKLTKAFEGPERKPF